MKELRNKGFTLTEIVIALVILSILAAVAVPSAMNYIKLAEFRKNESAAKTAYLAAESTLTWYRNSGEWEQFRKEVIHSGKQNRTFGEADKEKNGRIYGVMLNGGGAQESPSGKLAERLLSDYAYDGEFLDAAIAVEIDVDTGKVYAAFYATRCRELAYDGDDTDGRLNISAADGNRTYENRKGRSLGYYSAEDVTNVVDLKPVRLKVTAINLVNSETLSLNWSSNSRHENLDVDFEISFHKSGDGKKLFSTVIDLYELKAQGLSENQMTPLVLKDADGKAIGGETAVWAFPLTYQAGSGQRGRFSLVLDGMMSAELMEILEAKKGEKGVLNEYSTSITRLGNVIPELSVPEDIYAVVEARPTYRNMEGDSREYRSGSPVRSNTENTMFAGGTEKKNGRLDAKLTRFRHLSNIRYCGEEAGFALTNRNMDWISAGTGMYDTAADKLDPDKLTVRWRDAAQGERALDFPSIKMLHAGQTLHGQGADVQISNLRLGKSSIPGDETIKRLYVNRKEKPFARYLGLICESEGTVRNLTLQNPELCLDAEESTAFASLCGAGILCGRSEGKLEHISVKAGNRAERILEVRLNRAADREMREPAGIGGFAGIFAGKEEDGSLTRLNDGDVAALRGLSIEGNIAGSLPKPLDTETGSSEERALDFQYGIGGIFGYGWMGGDVKAVECQNRAGVTGNLFTGGIAGNLWGSYGESGAQDTAIEDCRNEGLILCSVKHQDEENMLEGRYFGGILGFGHHARMNGSFSASGRSENYRYTADQREQTLLGQYVGGIIGYGSGCQLTGCGTQADGYILGSDYVGGIAGGMSNDIKEAIKGTESIAVTTNAGYVIGNRYVGGIVGKNDSDTETITIKNCINNGIAAGYGRYIGGIVGYNGQHGVLEDCASYLSDYDSSIFHMVTDVWETAGDCAGGLAGYNSGLLVFHPDSEEILVKSVSSVVVGRNYVGGVIGFNDVQGRMEVSYTLLGGQIYGYGNAVGGCIGLNASEEALGQSLVIRPSSVSGKYYVGGCIGANMVDLTADRTAGGLKADNILGSIRGEAFTGGVIGYQRTYTQAQLGGVPLLDYLESGRADAPMLPEIGDGGIPTETAESENPHTLTLTNSTNAWNSLESPSNNIPIQSYIYTGGIVGYCERESRLVVKNCKNAGGISKLPEMEDAGGVSLKSYLDSQGMGAAAEEISSLDVFMAGGIISANLENQVIDNCANTGSMSGFIGLGGIVGFNAGGVFNCSLADNFGNVGLDYIGGIVGLNVRADSAEESLRYRDAAGKNRVYSPGTVAGCSTQADRNISGRSYVGGIAGYNMRGGVLEDNRSEANITAAGNYAGGIAGANSGELAVYADTGRSARTISSTAGYGVGGITGWNKSSGTILAAVSGAAGEVEAVSDYVSITGKEKAGGIVGIHEGALKTSSAEVSLVCGAKLVRALEGYAGGIAGEAKGNITRAVNRCKSVTANHGPAGGITAVNEEGATLRQCRSLGNVSSDQGYAGGIAAENKGTLKACTVGNTGAAKAVEISSRGTEEIGAVCSVNDGVIQDSTPLGGIVLSGGADVAGGVAGSNRGIIRGSADGAAVSYMPEINLSGARITVGGVAGENEASVTNVTAEGLTFEAFRNYQYLGGITGRNEEGASVKGCAFTGGVMTEGSSMAGNCYGGIAGENRGTLDGCSVEGVRIEVQGVYTATSTSTAQQKERLASHVGGVAGKNETGGVIAGCLIRGSDNRITVGSGMAGGITGYNKGAVSMSGDVSVQSLMNQGSMTVQELAARAGAQGIAADSSYVSWGGNNASLENFRYSGGNLVSAGRSLSLIVSNNGNLGGITAYNAPAGEVNYCATGNWYLQNKSNAIGVGTGGIIGMNESEQDLSFLLNRAFVGRQISANDTNRFAGGIIGNQNNTTREGWKIKNCVNYGTVYCLRTHYSGGIMGQWTGTGGTVEKCLNYGNLQTTYGTGWVGASGGIVAQLYHAYEGNEYNIIGCGNYGNIYGQAGQSTNNCANDSAGILGNVTAYRAGAASAQGFTIQVLDCVNGSGVEIYSNSMASGIVGFFSCDNPNYNAIAASTGNIILRVERCRNLASVLKGNNFVGGILGERYGRTGSVNTVLNDCYSLNRESAYYNKTNYPVISYANGSNAGNAGAITAKGSYYLCTDSFRFQNGTAGAVQASSAQLGRVDTNCSYYLIKDNVQYFLYLKPGVRINKNNVQISADGRVTSGGQEAGHVLFQIGAGDRDSYSNINSVVTKGSNFDSHVRTAYYRVEMGEKKTQMPKPRGVTLERDGNRVSIHAVPADGTDPFKYVATLYIENGGTRVPVKSGFEFYSEDFSVDMSQIAAAKSGALSVEIRAYSMFEDVAPSEPVDSGEGLDGREMLPNPEIRIEPEKNGNGHRYRFTLVNIENYKKFEGWHVAVKFMDGTPELRLENGADGYLELNADSLQQLIVQAESDSGDILPSAEVSVPAFLPAYRPSIALAASGGRGKAVPSCEIRGASLSELGITVTLDASASGNITTPPVYRAELTGVWKDGTPGRGKTAVLAAQDILTASNGRASAVFSNLPEYAAEADELKVRVWYAEPGLGPVYAYHSLDGETDANIYTIAGIREESGEPLWEYAYSLALDDSYFSSYRWASETLFTWLPRPNLDESTDMTPEFDADQHLQYTFRWDKGAGEYTAGNQYIVSLEGIRDGRRISIVTNREVSGNELTADAEEWSYEEVELTVTRKGDTAGKTVGLSSSRRYRVRQRLPRPAQPKVVNPDVNELYYRAEWSPIKPESGCGSYAVYIQPYEADGVRLAPPVLAAQVGTDEKQGNGTYAEMLNLEAYAGKKLRVYLTAQAEAGSVQYVDSVDGVTYELEIPKRINAPKVNWRKSWEYTAAAPLSPESFQGEEDQKGGLTIGLTPDAGSIPPGDSSYLLTGYVFDTLEHAESARTAVESGNTEGLAGLLASYPSRKEGEPQAAAVMQAAAGGAYTHTLRGLPPEYAGKWVLFRTRISAGNGQVSSKWTVNDAVWQLPYVKLNPPSVTVGNRKQEITVSAGANPDLPGEETWTANTTVLQWSHARLSDCSYVTLERKDGEKQAYRITEDSQGVKVFWKNADGAWTAVQGTQAESGGTDFILPGYQIDAGGVYTEAEIPYSYRVSLKAVLEVRPQKEAGFGYTLALPDAESLVTESGAAITDAGLRATVSAGLCSDVKENNPDSGQGSSGYLRSEEYEAAFQP